MTIKKKIQKNFSFANLSVKKKLMLGFVLSSIFIIIIGTLSLTSIEKAQNTSIIRSEMEHQISIIGNIKNKFVYNRATRKYTPKKISSDYKSLLKTNTKIINLLKDNEKSKMDSLRGGIKEREKAMLAYIKNAIVYDSIANKLMVNMDSLDALLNKDITKNRSTQTLQDNSTKLTKQIYKAQLKPGSTKVNDLKKSVFQLKRDIKDTKNNKAMKLVSELLSSLNDFKTAQENDWKIMNKSYKYLDNIVNYSNKLIRSHNTKTKTELEFIKKLIILISLFGTGLVYIISRLASNSTVKGIDSLEKISHQVAQGHIGTQIPTFLLKRKDEIGKLSNSYALMLTQFIKAVTEINKCSNDILNTSSELKGSSQAISVSSNHQASSLEEISSTLEEIVSNIQQNANNSIITKEKAEASTVGLQHLKEQNDKMYTSSVDIDSKTKIINEMAMQTNILSLNAAVQAALAGSHGKSFAVVAAEVKRLAEKSNDAANKIAILTEEGLKITQEGSNLADKLLPELETTHYLVSEIAEASKEQQIGVEQINNALVSLNSVSQENSIRADQLAQNAIHLDQQSNRLISSIDFFSLKSLNLETNKQNFFKKLFSRSSKKKK